MFGAVLPQVDVSVLFPPLAASVQQVRFCRVFLPSCCRVVAEFPSAGTGSAQQIAETVRLVAQKRRDGIPRCSLVSYDVITFREPIRVAKGASVPLKRFAWWRRNVGTESRGAHWFHMTSLLFVSQSELRKAPPSRCVLPRRPDPLTGRKRRHASLSANEGSWNPCFFFFVSSAAMDGTGFTETAPILGRTAFETCHRLLSIVFFCFF